MNGMILAAVLLLKHFLTYFALPHSARMLNMMNVDM